MVTKRSFVWLAAALGAVLLAACSGSAAGQAPGSPEVADSTDDAPAASRPEIILVAPTARPAPEQSITQALAGLTTMDLPGFGLTRQQLGGFGEATSVGARSGFISNEAAAERFPTLGLEGADLHEFGREGGYLIAYDDPQLGTFVGRPATIELGMELFSSPSGASEYSAMRWDELALSDDARGIEIEEVTPFAVAAEHGSGRTITATYEGYDRPINVAMASVQRGRLVYWVSLVDFDSHDRALNAERLVVILDEHVERILTGTREPQAAPTIPNHDHDAPVPRKKGSPDLAAVAMDQSDLPSPFHLDWSGYVADDDFPFVYEAVASGRPLAKFTSLTLAYLRYQVATLPEREDTAALIQERVNPAIEELAADFGATVGLRNARGERTLLPLGDSTLMLVFDGEHPPLGAYRYGILMIQHDRYLFLMAVGGQPAFVSSSSVIELAEAGADRLSSAVSP